MVRAARPARYRPAVSRAGMLAGLGQDAEAAAEEFGVALVKVIVRELPQAAAAAAPAAVASAEPAAGLVPVPVARQTASAG